MRFGRSALHRFPRALWKRLKSAMPMIETMGMTETAAPLLSNPAPEPRKPGSPGSQGNRFALLMMMASPYRMEKLANSLFVVPMCSTGITRMKMRRALLSITIVGFAQVTWDTATSKVISS